MIFSVISYNQERYILEVLESIKLQVVTHGGNEENCLYVYDDASRDQTARIAEAWLEKNRELFADVRISASRENRGTVRNGCQAIRDAIGKRMKMVAADDIVGPSSIYDAVPKTGMLFSPSVPFDDSGVLDTNLYYYLRLFCAKQDGRLKERIRGCFSKRNIFDAPGSFFSPELYANPGLLKALSKWTYIDDVPIWRYLYFDLPEIPPTEISFVPRMMYRVGSGVSTTSKNERAQEFLDEKRALFSEFFPDQMKPLMKRKPSTLLDIVLRDHLYGRLPVISGKKKELLKIYDEEARKAETHLRMVRNNASLSARELVLPLNEECS